MTNTAPHRIIFAGTPEFAVPALKVLLAENTVQAVYTQPDRPAGRGRQLQSSPVKQAAHAAGVAVYQPRSLRIPEVQQELIELAPDLIIVVAYGLLLPQAVLDAPRLGCINIHASLLPRWRGAAPIQHALLAGDKETGVTLMQMEVGLDTGPMLAQARLPITADMTAAQLHDALSLLGAKILHKHLPAILEKRLTPQVQNDSLACYANKISKQDAIIDWRKPAAQLERQIRAFNPWPIAQTTWQGQTLRIWQAQAMAQDTLEPPGRIIAENRNGVDVATGAGILRLFEVQMAGRRPQLISDFINAHRLHGHQLGS